jgi:hypothetical protein
MAKFTQKKSGTSAVHILKQPIPDIGAFDSVVRSLILKNPLGCTSYMKRRAKGRKNHPPIEKVREMYTAKFVYEDKDRKRVGAGSDTYNSVDGYHTGIAAVISNMANIASHGGKPGHVPDNDLFSVTLKCNDPKSGFFFLSIARDRITLSSYGDDAVLARVGKWADTVPALT